MVLNAPTVRRVLGRLSTPQLRKVKDYSDTRRFSHSWYWHGPEGNVGMDYRNPQIASLQASAMCALAVAFDVDRSTEPGNFWGAKVNQNLMGAMEHLSEASGGDASTVNYIHELSELTHEELVSIIDDSLNGKTSLAEIDVPDTLYEEYFDRSVLPLRTMDQAPTLRKILTAMTNEQLSKLLIYSNEKPFHHGWYWFGPEGVVGIDSDEARFSREGCGDPISVAFGLTPSRDAKSWRGCRLDTSFIAALEFWALHSGGESGMEDYVLELNSISSEELGKLIRSVVAEALLR